MKTQKAYILPVLILSLGLVFFSIARSSPASPAEKPFSEGQPIAQDEIPTDQIIVNFKSPIIPSELSDQALAFEEQRLSQSAGLPISYVRTMSGEAMVFRLPERLPKEQVQTISTRLEALPEVEFAEPDAIMQPLEVPDDPRYSDQWHYSPPSAGNYGINAPPAWDITHGSASIVAAVIDTGITAHVEFTGRTVPGYDFINYDLVANDGDGRDSNPSDPGDWITVAESGSGYFAGCPVSNSSWHGTHTAGTIGAASDNHLGVAGVNWNSKILPVRVLGKCGGYLSDIADGMRWAAGLQVIGVPNNTHPAKVLNLSLGGTGSCGLTYQNAINAITTAGVSVVVSAGNSNTNASGFRPANCSGVITVAATNRNGSRAYYSNYGSTVEISAPGGAQSSPNDPNGILSTLNTGTQGPAADTYIYYQGTSMAAPHVTGVISLLYSLDTTLLPDQVLQILQDTATHFPAGSTCNTSDCGSGIVNAGAALQELQGEPTITPTKTLTPTQTRTPSQTSTPTRTPTATRTPTSVPTGEQQLLYIPLIW